MFHSQTRVVQMGQANTAETHTAPSSPKQRISKKLRVQVWNTWIGAEKGKVLCPLCQTTEIQQGDSNWHCGHVIPEAHGGECNVHNLRPICPGCNASMSTKHMYDFALRVNENAISTLRIPKPKKKVPGDHRKSFSELVQDWHQGMSREQLNSLSCRRLKMLAKETGHTGYSRLRKNELVKLLS